MLNRLILLASVAFAAFVAAAQAGVMVGGSADRTNDPDGRLEGVSTDTGDLERVDPNSPLIGPILIGALNPLAVQQRGPFDQIGQPIGRMTESDSGDAVPEPASVVLWGVFSLAGLAWGLRRQLRI